MIRLPFLPNFLDTVAVLSFDRITDVYHHIGIPDDIGANLSKGLQSIMTESTESVSGDRVMQTALYFSIAGALSRYLGSQERLFFLGYTSFHTGDMISIIVDNWSTNLSSINASVLKDIGSSKMLLGLYCGVREDEEFWTNHLRPSVVKMMTGSMSGSVTKVHPMEEWKVLQIMEELYRRYRFCGRWSQHYGCASAADKMNLMDFWTRMSPGKARDYWFPGIWESAASALYHEYQFHDTC